MLQQKLAESLELPAEMTETPPPPRKMGIEINNTCNHQCSFCAYTVMEREQKRGNMDHEMVLRVLTEGAALGIQEVGFYATGEPFMNPDLTEYVRHAKKVGMTYTYVSTNGAASSVERMRETVEAGLDSLKFSVNAGTREAYRKVHGRDDFEKVIERIRVMGAWRKEAGREFRLFVTTVISPESPDGAERLSELLGNLVDAVCPVPMTSIGTQISDALYRGIDYGTDENLKRFSTPCSLLWTMLNVQKEGYLSACCSDFNNDLLVADLHTHSLAEAWHSVAFRELRRRHLGHHVEGILCEACIRQRVQSYRKLIPT